MSNNIYEILHFYIDPKTFALGARTTVSDAQKQIIKNATDRLLTIARNCAGYEEKKPSKHTAEIALRKFKSNYRHIYQVDFSSSEIRALIYNMQEFDYPGMFQAMAQLLRSEWKNRYLNGLLFFLLSNWDSLDTTNRRLLIDIFQEKIAIYDGKRDKFLLLQKHARFLSDNGAEMLGMALRKLDANQTEYCSIWSAPSVFFGLSSNKIDQEYYSKVISAYFGRDAISKLDLLRDILAAHNYDVTAKRIIPIMIVQNKNSVSEAKREFINSIAVRMIGSPDLVSRWTMKNGTPEEKVYLEEARTILNDWMKKKFISIFFEKCVHEPTRKKYWLDHIDLVSDLQVWCTPLSLSLLMEDKNTTDLISSNVRELSNESNTNKAALIMTIANYTFVEFSDIGCLYLFLKNGPYGSRISSNQILYFDEIRRMRVNTIQDFMLGEKEGKIDHRSGWEDLLDRWMSIHLHRFEW